MKDARLKELVEEGVLEATLQLHDKLNRIEKLLSGERLRDEVEKANVGFLEINKGIKENQSRLSLMTNELKGVVSMSRAALSEGRSFTETLELPQLLRAFSQEFAEFTQEMNSLRKLINKSSDLKDFLEDLRDKATAPDNV